MQSLNCTPLLELFVFFEDVEHKAPEEVEKILYFYPTGTSINDQLTAVGLSKALLVFSRFFCSPCTAMHTRNKRNFYHQFANNIWIVITVGLPNREDADSFCIHQVNDSVMLQVLSKLCDRFKLLYGPIDDSHEEGKVAKLKLYLNEFFTSVLPMLDLTRCDLVDWLDGIRYFNSITDNFLNVETCMRHIEYSCSLLTTRTSFFFDAQLTWSSMSVKAMRFLCPYLISNVFCIPPDQDLISISPTAKHMGRFLTGPSDLGDLCPAQLPIPRLHNPLKSGSWLQLIVYRALRATICLFVEDQQDLPIEFFSSFDEHFGCKLTELAVNFLSPSSPPSSHSLPSMGGSGEKPTTTVSARHRLASPKPSKSRSSSHRQSSVVSSLISSYISWDPGVFAVKSTMHVVHQGGQWCVIPASIPFLQIMATIREDSLLSAKSQNFETILKFEPDAWILFRRSNDKEAFLSITGKKLDVNRVLDEVRKVWTTTFKRFFLEP